MNLHFTLSVIALTWHCAIAPAADTAMIRFAGEEWTVRSGHGGPGPNTWSATNVWLDATGGLHLKLRERDGQWSCAEVTLRRRLGFGRYQFLVEFQPNQLDDNVVLGLFNYPTADVGEDATREIDIEFARWGRAGNPVGNYTVWPVEKALKPTTRTFEIRQTAAAAWHRFDWSASQIACRSWQQLPGSPEEELAGWTFAPADPEKRIARQPMPVHLNLWLFQGRAPKNGREVEVVIREFRFTPE